MKPTRTGTTSAASVVAALALTLAACGGGGGSGGSTGGGEITLGVIGPQSGPQAEIGQNQVAGAEVVEVRSTQRAEWTAKSSKLSTKMNRAHRPPHPPQCGS